MKRKRIYTKVRRLRGGGVALYYDRKAGSNATNAAIKNLTHGRIVVNPLEKTLQVGTTTAPVDISGIVIKAGKPETLILHEETLGKPWISGNHTQERSFTLQKGEKRDAHLLITPGKKQTEPDLTEADGYFMETYKYAGFFQHEGVYTDYPMPDTFRNVLEDTSTVSGILAPSLYRDALRQVISPHQRVHIRSFLDEYLLPGIKEYNDSLGTGKNGGAGKHKVRHPRGYDKEYVDLSPLYNFLGQMNYLERRGLPFPEHLKATTEEFLAVEAPKVDYTPINKLSGIGFNRAFRRLVKRNNVNAPEFVLATTEKRVAQTIKNRKTRNLPYGKGYPQMKYPKEGVTPDVDVTIHVKNKDHKVSKLFTKVGVQGLSIGERVSPDLSGHGSAPGRDPMKLDGRHAKRSLVPVTIRLPKHRHESYTFAALLHRPMPEDAFVKQWSLVLNGGRLWLCITVLVHRDHKPVDPKNTLTAGVDLRWRTLEPGVHLVASIHDPVMDASHDITIRFDDSNTKGDKSFPESDPRRVRNNTLLSIEEMCCIKMGLGRQSQRDLRHWARNNGLPSEDDDIPAALAAVRERHQAETDAIKSFVSTVEGATRSTISGIRAEVLTYIETTRDEYLFLDTYLDIVDLQARQSQLIELTKAYVMAHIRLFEPKSKSMLSWLPNVGMPKLQDIARGSSIDITLTRDVMEVLQIWSQTNQKLGRWLTYVHQWLAARKRYGYEIAADAIVRYLKSKNVMRINFETAIVKGLSESVDQYSPYGIRYSQHFRQWIGPGGFSSILERFAKKHGLIVEHVVPANTTRKCRHCGHINVVGASLTFRCARCTRMMGADVLLNQTHNAAANISKPKQFRKPVGRSDRKPPRTKAAKLGT